MSVRDCGEVFDALRFRQDNACHAWHVAEREVFVQPAPNPSSIVPAFLTAAESLGIPTFADQNGVMQEGSGGAAITNVRIRDGRRLKPALVIPGQ